MSWVSNALITAILICSSLVANSASAVPCRPSDRQKSIAEITAIEHEMAGAQGVNGVTRTWAPDMVWYEIGPVEIHGGKPATSLTAKQFQALGQVRTRILRLQVNADCELGYAFSVQNFVADTANGKTTINFMMRETDIFERRAGKWSLVHQHLSLPVDLASGQAVISSRDLLDYPLSVPAKP